MAMMQRMEDNEPSDEHMGHMGDMQGEGKMMVEIDPAMLGGAEYEPGEMLQLKVVGRTAEGMLQCSVMPSEGMGMKEDGWEADFDKSMNPPEEMS